MVSAVYLHDGEHQVTVRFPTEQDRERFKAHYRLLDALGVQAREECDAALRLAAQLRDDYAWLLAQIDVFGPHWNEAVTVDGEGTTEGANIMEMARNRFRYQREDHQAAYDAMRALVPPNETGEDR